MKVLNLIAHLKEALLGNNRNGNESVSPIRKIDPSSSKTPGQAFQHLIEAYKKNGPLPRKELDPDPKNYEKH